MIASSSKVELRPRILPLALMLITLLLLCVGFGWWQNHHGTIGGAISLAKVLWLFTALAYFFVAPGWLSRDASLSAPVRSMFGVFFAGYLIRAVIEMPMLLWSHAWRVEYGMLHNAVMGGFVWHLRRGIASARPRDAAAFTFVRLLIVALISETLNAFLFGRAGSPQTGQYFANDDAVFVWINRITWLEIAVLAPGLAWWLRRYHAASRHP